MHERVEAVLGGDRRGKNAELLVVGGTEYDLFAPVAEEVDAESRGGFGAVVGGASFGGEDHVVGFLFPIPFRNTVAVEDFAEEVAVPPDAEIARGGVLLGDFFALHSVEAADAGAAGGPHFIAGVTRVEIEGETAADVGGGFGAAGFAPEQCAGGGVAEFDGVGVFRVFVDIEDFETGTVRIEVGDVHGVTVTELGGVARSTITVDTHGTVDDFVAAIAVDVGDADAVVALAAVGIGAVGGAVFIAVEEPALGEFAVAPVPRDEGGAGVVAAAHDNAGADAVEVGDASEEAIDAVAVAVAPVVDVAAGG